MYFVDAITDVLSLYCCLCLSLLTHTGSASYWLFSSGFFRDIQRVEETVLSLVVCLIVACTLFVCLLLYSDMSTRSKVRPRVSDEQKKQDVLIMRS